MSIELKRLVALQKAVLLRREYENALFALRDVLAGSPADNMSDAQYTLLHNAVGAYNDGADDIGDVEMDCVDDLLKDWSALK